MTTIFFDGLFIDCDLEKIYEGKTSLEVIYEESKKNGFERFVLLQNGAIKTIPSGVKSVVLKDMRPVNILNTLYSEAKTSNDVAVFDAGCPFYDSNFISKILERHNSFIADYTYCIGFIEGLTPVILRKEVIKEMAKLVEDVKEVRKDYLFYSLSKDINSFDIESVLSDIDLRIYRIKLGCNDQGEKKLTDRIYKKFGKSVAVEGLTEYFFNNISENFTVPYTVIFDLTARNDIKSTYKTEFNNIDCEADYNIVIKTIEQLTELNEKTTVLLTGFGEPLLYTKITDLIKFVNLKNLSLVIETSGLSITSVFFDKITEVDKSKITFVVTYDCYDKETYLKLHPGTDFDLVNKNIEFIKENGFTVYKSVVRMFENEVEIEKYIRNKKTDDLIIRKFSNYCKSIPDRKVVDLQPLERIPCFHLRREFYVNPLSEVWFCMYSTGKIAGDLKKENVHSIISKLENAYKDNCEHNYKDFCKECDDYYIFNF